MSGSLLHHAAQNMYQACCANSGLWDFCAFLVYSVNRARDGFRIEHFLSTLSLEVKTSNQLRVDGLLIV